jgi:quercetin dioxygenase-like cupin family protein
MQVTYGPGFGLASLGAVSLREKVELLEAVMLPLPQVECPVRHYFAPGMYAREMSIPAGTVVTGAVHKTENLIVVSKGRLHIVTADGTREVSAGDTFTCKAGMKNAVYALEDSRWTNFMANPDNETDTDKLTELLTESKASELLGGPENKQLLKADLQKVEA